MNYLLPKIQSEGLTFQNIVDDIENIIKYHPNYMNQWDDFTKANAGRMLIELFAWIVENLGIRVDLLANESYLATAKLLNNKMRLLKFLGYSPLFPVSAEIIVTVELSHSLSGSNVYQFTSPLTATTAYTPYSLSADSLNFELIRFDSVTQKFDYLNGVSITFTQDTNSSNLTSDVLFYEGITTRMEYTILTDNGETINLGRLQIARGSISIFLYSNNKTTITELKEVDSFLSFNAQNTIDLDGDPIAIPYMVTLNEDREVEIQFGSISILPSQDRRPYINDEIIIIYRTCNGVSGNIPIQTINTTISINYSGEQYDTIFTNYTAGYSGQDEETIDHAAEYAPLHLKTVDKTVTQSDYNTKIRAVTTVLKSKTYGYGNITPATIYSEYGCYLNPYEVWNYIILYKTGWQNVLPSDYNNYDWFTFLLENRFNEKYSFRKGEFNQANSIFQTNMFVEDELITYTNYNNTYTFKNFFYIPPSTEMENYIVESDGSINPNLHIKLSTTSQAVAIYDTINQLHFGNMADTVISIADKINTKLQTYYGDTTKDYCYVINRLAGGSLEQDFYIEASSPLITTVTLELAFDYGDYSLFELDGVDGLITPTSVVPLTHTDETYGIIYISGTFASLVHETTYYFKLFVDGKDVSSQIYSFIYTDSGDNLESLKNCLNAIPGMDTKVIWSNNSDRLLGTAISIGDDVYMYPLDDTENGLLTNLLDAIQVSNIEYTKSAEINARTKLVNVSLDWNGSASYKFKLKENASYVNNGNNIEIDCFETDNGDYVTEINASNQSISTDINAQLISKEMATVSTDYDYFMLNIDERGWVKIDITGHDETITSVANIINTVLTAHHYYNGGGKFADNNCVFGTTVGIYYGSSFPYDRFYMNEGVGISAGVSVGDAVIDSFNGFGANENYRLKVVTNGLTTTTYTIPIADSTTITWQELFNRINCEIDRDYLFTEFINVYDEYGISTGYIDIIIRSKNYDEVKSVEILPCSGPCGDGIIHQFGRAGDRPPNTYPVTTFGDYSGIATVSNNKLILTSPNKGEYSKIEIKHFGISGSIAGELYEGFVFADATSILTCYGEINVALITNELSDYFKYLIVENGSPIIQASTFYLNSIFTDETDVALGSYFTTEFDNSDTLYKPYARRLYDTVQDPNVANSVDINNSNLLIEFTQDEVAASEITSISGLSLGLTDTYPGIVGNTLVAHDTYTAGVYVFNIGVDGLGNEEITVTVGSATDNETAIAAMALAVNTALQASYTSVGVRYGTYSYFAVTSTAVTFTSPTLHENQGTLGYVTITKPTSGVDGCQKLFDLDYAITNYSFNLYTDNDYFMYLNTTDNLMHLKKTYNSEFVDGNFYAHFIDDRRNYDYNGDTNFLIDEDSYREYLDQYKVIGMTNVFKKTKFATFDISGTIYYDKKYKPEVVQASVENTLNDLYSIEKRNYGQPVILNEIVSVLHDIDGVNFVDIDYFGKDYEGETSNQTFKIDSNFNEILVLCESTDTSGIVFTYVNSSTIYRI